MRIVGGRFRGYVLAPPAGNATRPTSDRAREAIFNILLHGIPDFRIEGARVLDLFAGTGALGLEALSRGAIYCMFIENCADARALIRRNIEALQLTGVTKVFRRDATDLGNAGLGGRYNLAFLDPPYRARLGERALVSAATGGWLAAGAKVVFEESKQAAIELPIDFTAIDCRIWGETQVVFAQYLEA